MNTHVKPMTLIKETDYGTPHVESHVTVTLEIDGREITVPFDRIGFKQLRVAGSVGYTIATWVRTLKLLSEGLRPSRIVTHRFRLEDWQAAFELFERKDATKVLLRP